MGGMSSVRALPTVVCMARDPEILRGSAAHFRRVAKILADKKAVAELLEIATGLEDRLRSSKRTNGTGATTKRLANNRAYAQPSHWLDGRREGLSNELGLPVATSLSSLGLRQCNARFRYRTLSAAPIVARRDNLR